MGGLLLDMLMAGPLQCPLDQAGHKEVEAARGGKAVQQKCQHGTTPANQAHAKREGATLQGALPERDREGLLDLLMTPAVPA